MKQVTSIKYLILALFVNNIKTLLLYRGSILRLYVVILAVFLFNVFSLAQTSITKPKERQRIHLDFVPADKYLLQRSLGTFDPKRAIFKSIKGTPVRGVPDYLTDISILHDFVDSNQYFYQSLKAGLITQKLYDKISAHIDSAVLTPEWVSAITISAVVGRNKSGKRVVIVDTNNDGDFAKEPELDFKPISIPWEKRIVNIEGAMSQVSFEYFEGGKIKRRTAPILFSYMEGAAPTQLEWEVRAYPVGEFNVRGEKFSVALEPKAVFRPGKYNFLYIDVDHDGIFDPDREGLETYPISDPFNIGGIGWRITKLSADGSYLEIERVTSTVEPRSALREGKAAPNFIGKTITGENFSLLDLRGKYVLLNFAATWCGYCLAELPEMKSIYETFDKNRLLVLTVMEDENQENLKRFLIEKGLSWTHINQSRGQEIPNLYRILGFPTNYLINPDGIIVARGSALRGKNLASTLRQHLESNSLTTVK